MADEVGMDHSVILKWIKMYQANSEVDFDSMNTNASYTKGFKEQVVLEYLNGDGSFVELAIKYNIPSPSTIKKWVKDHNSHIELKDYIPEGKKIYMTKSKMISKEERIEIAKYCIEHDLDYVATDKIYETTYANVFNWVKKYKEKGEDGLGDNRGRHKKDEELDETEKLKRQLKQKEHELEMALLEVKLLKKLDEIERRRFKTWDDYAVMSMVESGLGISILPNLILKRIPYRIVAKPLNVPAYRDIGIAQKSSKTASLAVRRFMKYLQYR